MAQALKSTMFPKSRQRRLLGRSAKSTSRTDKTTGDVETYTWDHRNRLVSVIRTDDSEILLSRVDYYYDVKSRLIAREADVDGDLIVDAAESYLHLADAVVPDRVYVGDTAQPPLDQVAAVLDADGDVTGRFLWGAAVDQILAEESLADVHWSLADHLGTVREVLEYYAGTDSTTVAQHLAYTAFGQPQAATDVRFTYTGKWTDATTALQYNNARWYAANDGRWISEGPIGFSARVPCSCLHENGGRPGASVKRKAAHLVDLSAKSEHPEISK